MDKATVRDYRCPICGRINFRGYLAPGSFIRMKCWHRTCRAWMLIRHGEKPQRDEESPFAPVQKIDNVASIVV